MLKRGYGMNKKNIDIELIGCVLKEMSDRSLLILKLIDPKDEKVLKHLAASQLHLGMFAQDILNYPGVSKPYSEKEMNKFIEMCGCNFKKEITE